MKYFYLFIASILLSFRVYAAETLQINQWRICAVSENDFQKRAIPAKPDWVWIGNPSSSFKSEKMFAHDGKFAFYVHFPVSPFPETAHPLLIINGLPEGSAVLLAGKTLTQLNRKQKGSDDFSMERWYQIPVGALMAGRENRLEIWSPAICKSKAESVLPVSQIVFENPDILAERERKRKLMYPYLHDVEDTEDPYVARHW